VVSALPMTKPFEFGAKLKAYPGPHKPTTVAFGNGMVGHSRMAHLFILDKEQAISYLYINQYIPNISIL